MQQRPNVAAYRAPARCWHGKLDATCAANAGLNGSNGRVAVCAGLYGVVCKSAIAYLLSAASGRRRRQLDCANYAGETIALMSVRGQAGPGGVIYFGGNAEDVSQDIPDLVKAFPDRATYLLHYPSYGGSPGSPSQKAIFAEALALFDFVHAEHADTVVIGRSLGSGVAVWTASQRPVSRLLLITPFESLGDVAQHAYPFLPVRWLLLDRYESPS